MDTILPINYVAVLLLAFLSGLTTLIGVALAFYLRESTKGIVIGIGFSAGIMLLISIFELIPESFAATGTKGTLISVILGIGLVGILNFIIPHTHFAEENGHLSIRLKTAYLVAFGLVLHDFPEGFAMASSYIHSPALGLLIALAIAIHNIPEEFAMAVPILQTEKRTLLFKLAFLSGLAEPAGAVLGLIAVSFLPGLNPLFMAFAAGAMMFVSVHELLPMACRYKRIWLFVLGMIVSVVVYLGLSMLVPE